ncbi:hypothetical protein ADEAN_000030600 [Angomonas deanei]|uniref:Uncharacterized protein n=1 Tax=Angomonas deanei TaxID=59799 RepID=A0A7G2BZE2_9TRYP|nr:hypothetical protein ADEAN_000030600 [Angomonas deanei]
MPLVDTISSDVLFQLRTQSDSLESAEANGFLHDRGDISPMLCSIEIILRLSFALPDSAMLSRLAQRCVKMLNGDLSKIINFENGGYPSTFVLLNFYAFLSVFTQEWASLGEGKKADAVFSIKKFCAFIDCSKARDVEAALPASSDAHISNDAKSQLVNLLRDLAADIPFDFAEKCPKVLQNALGPLYKPPSAKLLLDESHKDTQEDPQTVKQRKNSPPPPTQIVSPAPAPKQNTSKNGIDCVSPYHEKYGKGKASSKCKYCTVCHMLEVVFNDCKADCPWNHWPSETKLKYHLSRNPKLLKIASERLFKLNRGEKLEPYTNL